MLLVSEAGGRCNDFLRGDGLTKGNPVLVAGAGVYDALATLTGIR
jgi:myo-inositol-1(or 4)-monophosphatase